jgi:hypothetical protein
MTNPTANRAYDMPASTDLVTNLPADFATFGDAVDLDISSRGGYTTTATAAGTTTLTIASNRNQRFTGTTTQTVVMPVASTLAVGARWKIQNKSTGIVTVQSSGGNTIYAIPAATTIDIFCILASGTTAASWDYDWAGASAAPAAGGLTKVLAATFTAVANTGTTFDGVFTSTYKKYMVVFNGCISSGGVAVNIALRVAGVTIANNYGLSNQTDYTGGSTNVLSNNAATVNVGTWATAIGTNLNLLFTAVGNASERPAFGGIGSSGSAYGVLTVGAVGNTGIIDGFIITPASGTITGTITVYGLAN